MRWMAVFHLRGTVKDESPLVRRADGKMLLPGEQSLEKHPLQQAGALVILRSHLGVFVITFLFLKKVRYSNTFLTSRRT